MHFFIILISGCAQITQLDQTPKTIKSNEENVIKWQTSYEDALELAKSNNKSLMLVFYGVSSKRLDENVFSSQEVIKLSKDFINVKLGADQNELTKRYGIAEFPTVVFADARGNEYDRISGYKSSASFVALLSKALTPIDVDYDIRFDIAKNQAVVKCRLKNIRQKTITLSLWEKSVKPTNISFDSAEGVPVWEEIGENFWQMKFNTSSMKTVTIQYEVKLNVLSRMDYNPAYISYVGDKYGILDGHMLFLSPYNFNINGKVRVIMNLPKDWKALTTWEEESPLVFSANYVLDVVDTVFCIGQFQYLKREINGKEVYAVYCGTSNIGSELDRKADMVARIFEDYMSRFGDFPFKKYIAIYAEHTPDNKFIHGTAHGSGFAGPIEMPLAYTIQFTAHEIFHIWNGRILSQKSHYEVWFKEGFTQYYGYITPYRAGLYGKEQFIYYLKDDYQNYIQNYESSGDIALSRINEGIARQEGYTQAESISNFIMYRKGALVASLVNEEIKKATNGNKDLDDLIRYMLVEYRDKAYSSDDILKSLNKVTGKDFTKFFSDYIYGRAKLPLTQELIQSD